MALDGTTCELGRWLAASRRAGRIADHDWIDQIHARHEALHVVAVDLVAARTDEQPTGGFEQLHAASDALLADMRAWRQAVADH